MGIINSHELIGWKILVTVINRKCMKNPETLSSIIFFLLSNFGVWLFSEFYTKDLEGLLQCYVLAIPFFTNTIISTFVFGILFEISIMSKNKVTSLLYK